MHLSLLRKATLILLIFLTIFFGVLMGKAKATPLILAQEISHQSLYRSISFDYRVYPIESNLYPLGTNPLSPGEDPFFTKLTDRIYFQVKSEITADTPLPEETSFSIYLLLRSEGQWEKKLPFTPLIEANFPDERMFTYTSSFDLPLKEVEQLCEAIVEETGVWPRGGYELIINSSLSTVRIDDDGEFLSTENPLDGFNREYKFLLNGPMIQTEPEANLFFEDTKVATETINTANHFSIFGLKMGVSQARILFITFFCILILLTGGFIYFNLLKKRLSNLEKIELKLNKMIKRYGSRIVKAEDLKEVSADTIQVEIKDLDELLRLADERERSVIQVTSVQRNGDKIVSFYLLGEEALYYYSLPSGITLTL